jgi:hypothetical protein
MADYTNWKVNDVVNICVSVTAFCGTRQGLIFGSNAISKNPDVCATVPGTSSCPITINNVGITFKLVKGCNNNNTPSVVYRSLGQFYTNSNGQTGVQFTVLDSDLANYNSSGGSYRAIMIITDSKGQDIIELSNCTHNITISQNPCTGVTCPPNDCTGFDLYTYSCNPSTGTCDRTLLTPLSPTCGYVAPSAETHYLYFKVSDLYPISFVISGISPIFQAATFAIRGYTNYYVEGVDFDQEQRIITITISKTVGLGTIGHDSGMQTLLLPLIPIAYIIAIIIGAIGGVIGFLISEYMGSKSVTGETVSTRVITVIPQVCTGNATAGTTNCVNPTSPMVITVEYCLGKVCTTRDITDGNPITFSAPTDVGITVTGQVKDNQYYTVIKKDIDKGITNDTVTLKFMAKDDATITPSAKDATTNNPISGSYIVYEETEDNHLVEVQRGSLDATGTMVPPLKAKAGVYTCIVVIPTDIAIHKTEMVCVTPSAGEVLNPIILIKTCAEAKNHISVRTVYISSVDGSRYGYTADNIQIKTGTTVTNTIIPTTDVTYIDGLTKDTNYTVHIIKPGYTMLNNDQQISFTTECDTTVALLVESNPPVGTRDITIEVRNAAANVAIQGANVTLDATPLRKTDATGTVSFMAIPDGVHDLKIALEAYKDNISKITVSSASTTFTKTIVVDQANATVDTRIYEFTNVGDAIATKPIKFKGYLQYLDATMTPANYKALTDATVVITIKDANNAVMKTFTTVTGSGLLNIGYFETGEWLITNELANTGMTAEASFDGIGSYKPSSFSLDYTIAAADACLVPLPWGGCLLSKETGTSLLLLGALAVGGIVLIGSASKSITGGTTKRVVEIPAHYTPPEIQKENTPK